MKPRFGIIAATAGFALLVGLGLWQLDRRDGKQQRLQAVEAGLAREPRLLTDAPTKADAWTPASAQGRWRPDGLVRIAPKTWNGQVGGDYAAPFVLQNGDPLIVLLGWAPNGAPAPLLEGAPTTVEGILAPSPRPSLIMPDNAPNKNWIWLEPKAIAAAIGLDPARTPDITLRLSTPPNGLTARTARPNLPNNHLQYAFTWFGLAAGLAAVGFFASRRPR
jgi:surfeit locus 1 family protein